MLIALKFYTDVLEMRVKSHWGKDYAELETSGLTIGLYPATQNGPKPGTSGSISIGLEVDDLDSTVAKFKEKGVTFIGKVMEDGPVRLGFFGDPDGNAFYLTQIKRGMGLGTDPRIRTNLRL
ncbi:MAG TPA: VOC family protein [Nitrososphaerales archaeon]|nr:VOC family protein [Nitrososphaerales archaeon]